MTSIRQVFFAIIFILIPIEYLYGYCLFCGMDDPAGSCECETKFKVILDKMQSHSDTFLPFKISQATTSTGFSLTSSSHSRGGLELEVASPYSGTFHFNPLCSIRHSSESIAYSIFGQLLYTCKCVINASDQIKIMLTKMSTKEIHNPSTNIEWLIAFTEAFTAFTQNQQHNIYYWVNATSSDGSNEWIFIVISLNPQTDSPCFSVMSLSSSILTLHQETDVNAVMTLMNINLTNKATKMSGYFK